LGFLDENYLLQSEVAKEFYLKVKDLPIVDLHNHSDVKEIVENKGWNNIWEVEIATDHYVWELLRRRGVPEEKITGEAPAEEKWHALAEVFQAFAGNPTYEWIHLDLKRRFGIEENISKETAELIWQKAADCLSKESFRPQSLLKDMNVNIMCTTDEPVSELKYHKQAKDKLERIRILPTWRPDKAMKIENESWKDYIIKLGEVTKINVTTLQGLIEALRKTHNYFAQMGCRASDHDLNEPLGYYVKETIAKKIYEKALNDEELNRKEINDFKAYMFYQFGEMNQEKGWIMQLHIGVVRNYNQLLYDKLGRDSGGDIIRNNIDFIENMRYFINEFNQSLNMVLYYLDPGLLPVLASIARSFPNVNLGAPWWFNDSPLGIEEHLKYISSVDLLSNHAGMVTDSRKIISFGSRTEMFRRALCDVLGNMVLKGQMPYQTAEEIAQNISYYRPLNFLLK